MLVTMQKTTIYQSFTHANYLIYSHISFASVQPLNSLYICTLLSITTIEL
jgi:hypothetical protein